MTMHVKLTAHFLNGRLRVTRTYTGCADIPEALARFERDARTPVNLGRYDVTSCHFGFEPEAQS